MTRFTGARQAKEFLVSRITAQAEFEGVSLSEIERKELYFSETGWTLPDMMQVNEEFDQSYDQYEYERKIADLVRNVRERDENEGSDGAESWAEAVLMLEREDHYIVVMVGKAGTNPLASRVSFARRQIFNSVYQRLRGKLKTPHE